MKRQKLASNRGILLLLVLALVAVACGGSGGATTTVEVTTPVATTEPPTDTTMAASTTAAAGGEVTFDVGVTEDTITLGLLADLTGPFAPLVQDIVATQEVYWDIVNEAGGIAGKTDRD